MCDFGRFKSYVNGIMRFWVYFSPPQNWETKSLDLRLLFARAGCFVFPSGFQKAFQKRFQSFSNDFQRFPNFAKSLY